MSSPLDRTRWYALATVVVSCILVSVGIGGMNAAYSQRLVKSDHQRWCALLVPLDTELPPTSTIKPIIHQLRGEFECGN